MSKKAEVRFVVKPLEIVKLPDVKIVRNGVSEAMHGPQPGVAPEARPKGGLPG